MICPGCGARGSVADGTFRHGYDGEMMNIYCAVVEDDVMCGIWMFSNDGGVE